MTVTLDDLGHVAEIEIGNLVAERQPSGEKLRLYLSDGMYIDLWLSRRLHERSVSMGTSAPGWDILPLRQLPRLGSGETSPAILTISMLAHKTR